MKNTHSVRFTAEEWQKLKAAAEDESRKLGYHISVSAYVKKMLQAK